MKNKKKSRWVLYVSAIVLSLCAIAVGVYAIKTASLSISGTIGFEVRNVKANVTAYIKNDCVDASGNPVGQDGTLRTDYAIIANTEVDGASSNAATMSLGSFYFGCEYGTTTPSEVYMKFVIENTSNYAIMAYITPAANDDIIFNLASGSSSYVKIMQSSGDEGKGEIIIKLTLNPNSSGEYEALNEANNISITMTLDKYEEYFVAPITGYGYNTSTSSVEEVATTNRLCTYLGHGTTTDKAEFELLRWYAFAVRGTGDDYTTRPSFVPDENTSIEVGTEKWYSLTGVDMSEVDYKGYTFWFIQEYVVGGGYSIWTDAEHTSTTLITGRQFNSDTSQTYSNIYRKNAEYPSDIYYKVSAARAGYLITTGINRDKSLTITSREVTDTETNKSGLSTTFTSKYWLISRAELGLLANTSLTNLFTGYQTHILTYGIGNKTGTSSRYGASWWLRSPHSTSDSFGCEVSSGGRCGYASVDSYSGVRAAFQISIEA